MMAERTTTPSKRVPSLICDRQTMHVPESDDSIRTHSVDTYRRTETDEDTTQCHTRGSLASVRMA
jgi:hypothetical protein